MNTKLVFLNINEKTNSHWMGPYRKQIIDYVISISKYTQSVKFIMEELGLCNELCRPPYLNLNLDEKKKLKKYLNLILK